MPTRKNIVAFAILAILAAACGKKWSQAEVEAKVKDDWRRCNIVVPEKVVIEQNDGKVLRYSYVLRMVEHGSAVHGFTCYQNLVLLIQARANKDMHQLKKGEEIEVIQEISAR